MLYPGNKYKSWRAVPLVRKIRQYFVLYKYTHIYLEIKLLTFRIVSSITDNKKTTNYYSFLNYYETEGFYTTLWKHIPLKSESDCGNSLILDLITQHHTIAVFPILKYL